MLIFNLVFINPVISPQIVPAIKTKSKVKTGFIPLQIKTAVIAPPVAKLPSTVISATFKILKVK